MQKQILFLFTLFFLASISLEAQLEMNSSGEVGIGASPISGIDFYTPEAKIVNLGVGQSPSSSYKLLVNGVARFQASTVAGFEFSAYDTWEMKMLPSFNNMCRIGSSTKSFYQVYTRYLYVNGSQVTSDLRTKENIRDLSHSLEKLVSVRGVKFDFITPDESEISPATKEEMDYLDKDRMGFIAQELMVVFPELVKYDEEADLFSVDYLGVIPILVEAMKEQQLKIEELQLVLESSGDLKGATVPSSVPDSQMPGIGSTEIFQNAPNPFTKETIIRYNLGESVESATLYIYDMSGKQLRSYNLHNRGKSKINIVGGELDPGMYMYSLVANGLLIGTKQMLLTD